MGSAVLGAYSHGSKPASPGEPHPLRTQDSTKYGFLCCSTMPSPLLRGVFGGLSGIHSGIRSWL